MNLSRCPHCNEELSRIEQLDGKCVSCGKEFERAFSASHGEPEESPYQPSASINEPLNLKQKESFGLLIAFLATLLTPIGLIYSCYIGLQKGSSICAAPGCMEEAHKEREYSGGVKLGYCDEHYKSPPDTIRNKQRLVPYALCFLALLFAGHFIMAFSDAYTGKVKPSKDPRKKPRDPFRYFLWLTIGGIVFVNGIFWLMARYVCL